jgi:hypothetical protein
VLAVWQPGPRGDRERFRVRQCRGWATTRAAGAGAALEQLHHRVRHVVGGAEIVNRQDAGMRQRGDRLCSRSKRASRYGSAANGPGRTLMARTDSASGHGRDRPRPCRRHRSARQLRTVRGACLGSASWRDRIMPAARVLSSPRLQRSGRTPGRAPSVGLPVSVLIGYLGALGTGMGFRAISSCRNWIAASS